MKSKKYAAAVVSTSGRAGSKRRVVSQRMLPRARARKEVCDQRGGGGVREQRRHCHGVGWEEGGIVVASVRVSRSCDVGLSGRWMGRTGDRGPSGTVVFL